MLSNLGKPPLLKVGLFTYMSLTFAMTCLPTKSHDPFCQNISQIIRVGLGGRMEKWEEERCRMEKRMERRDDDYL